MSIKSEFIKSIFANWIGILFRYALALVATPIIVHSLGNEKYGIWSLAISITGYYGIIDFGISTTAVKLFSEYFTKNDSNKCNAILNTVIFIYLIMAVIVILVSFFIAVNSETLFKVSQDSTKEMLIVFIIVGINLALTFMFKIFNSIIIALRRFDINNTVTISVTILRTLCIIVFLKLGYGLITMAILVVCFDTLISFLNIYFSMRLFPNLRLSRQYINLKIVRENYKFALNNFLIHFSHIVFQRIDQVVIGFFIGVQYIVFFAIAESLVKYIRKLPNGVTKTLLPFASHFDAKGDHQNVNTLIYIISKYIFSFSVFSVFIFYEFGQDIIFIWMGPGYESCYVLLVILMLAEVVILVTNVIGRTLIGIGKNKEYAAVSVGETFVKSLSCILLIGKYGLLGVVYANLIAAVLFRGILLPVLLNRSGTFFIFKRYFSKTLLPVFIGFVPLTGIFYGFVFIVQPDYSSLLELLNTIIFFGCLFCIVFYKIVFNEIRITKKMKIHIHIPEI